MSSRRHRTTERTCVGLYALVVVASVLTVSWDTTASSPGAGEPVPMGFLEIALFWLCILVATSMVCVLLAVNALRFYRGEGTDRVVVGLALAVPGGLLAALAVNAVYPASRLPLVFATVGLVVAPAALLAATFRPGVVPRPRRRS